MRPTLIPLLLLLLAVTVMAAANTLILRTPVVEAPVTPAPPPPFVAPDHVVFAPVAGAALTTEVRQVANGSVNAATLFTVSGVAGAQIRVGQGAWGTSVTVPPGALPEVRLTTPNFYRAVQNLRVDFGGRVAYWRVSTLDGPDLEPDPFTFVTAASQPVAGRLTTEPVQVTGFIGPVEVHQRFRDGFPNLQLYVNGAPFVGGQRLMGGETLRLEGDDPRCGDPAVGPTGAWIMVGNTTGAWVVPRSAPSATADMDPGPVAIPDLTRPPGGGDVQTAAIPVGSDFIGPILARVSGPGRPQVAVQRPNGAGGFVLRADFATTNCIWPGDNLLVRLRDTIDGEFVLGANDLVTTSVTLGTRATSWTVRATDPLPVVTPFAFTDVPTAEPRTQVFSETITLPDFGPVPLDLSVTGDGTPGFRLNGGNIFPNRPVRSGSRIQLVATSPDRANAEHVITVRIGAATTNWRVRSYTDWQQRDRNTVEVLSADYGTHVAGAPVCDQAPYLRGVCAGKAVCTAELNDWLCAVDPDFGIRKNVRITWRCSADPTPQTAVVWQQIPAVLACAN